MIDTTTVNHVIDKFTQAWEKVSPSIGMGFEEYCRYIVFQEYMNMLIVCIMALGVVICIPSFLIAKTLERDNSSEWGVALFLVGLISACIGLFGIIGICVSLSDLLTAINFPEIYTIEHIINMAK